MTTTQMNMLIVTARCLNFTEAANLLYMTPSALSRQIRAMEKELNLQLFIRDNRSVRLTPAGAVFMEDLKKIYDGYCSAADRAQQIQRGMSAQITIGVLDGHLLGEQFPKLIREMDRRYPNVLITLFHASFGELSNALDEGRADLVVTTEFSLEGRGQVEYIGLSRTQEYLITTKESALARKKTVSRQDLCQETFVVVSAEDSVYAYERSMSVQHLCGCNIKVAPDLGTVSLWVQSGIGFGIVNSHNYLTSDMSLYSVPLDAIDVGAGLASTGSDLVIGWHKTNVNAALHNFLELTQGMKYQSHPPVPMNLRQI